MKFKGRRSRPSNLWYYKPPSRRDPTESPMSTKVCRTYCKGRDLKHYRITYVYWGLQGLLQVEGLKTSPNSLWGLRHDSWTAARPREQDSDEGQTVWLPRLMALVRLIYLGFLENFGPPIFIYFYIFLHIFHIFLDLKLIVDKRGAPKAPPTHYPINFRPQKIWKICKNV